MEKVEENVENKEYVFYNINVTMTSAKAFKEIELVGQVRDIVTGSFTVNNPLNIDVTIPHEQIIIENECLSSSKPLVYLNFPLEVETSGFLAFEVSLSGKGVISFSLSRRLNLVLYVD